MAIVAVTGGLGYLGAAVSTALRREGHDVLAIDNMNSSRMDGLGDIRIIPADVADRGDVDGALSYAGDAVGAEGLPDVVVHLAAIAGVEDCRDRPLEAARVNVGGTRQVASWCRRHDVPLVFASSLGIYPPGVQQPVGWPGNQPAPPHFYGVTKAIGEQLVGGLATEMAPAVAIQKSNVYGEYDVGGETISKQTVANFFLDRALEGEDLPVYRPGWQTRDFLHVLDAAEAYVAAVDALLEERLPEFTRFPIGGEDEWTIRDLAETIAASVPADVDVDLVRNPRPTDPMYQAFEVDTSAARRELGWQPKRELEDLLGATIHASG